MTEHRFVGRRMPSHSAASSASNPLAGWSCDLATNALVWEDGVFEIFGLPGDRPITRPDAVACYCDESRETMEWLRAGAIASRRGFSMEAEIARADGTRRWMRLIAHVASDMGRAARLHGTKQDISGERCRREAMRHASEHDPLTALPNAAAFDRIFLASVPAVGFSPLGALALVQITNLDAIHARYGYDAGDACLGAVAGRLAGLAPPGTFVARIDGAVFALLFRTEPARALLDRKLTALLRDAALSMAWRGEALPIGLATGIAQPASAVLYDAEELMARARHELAGRLF